MEQYALPKEQKNSYLVDILNNLHHFHYAHCDDYRRLTVKLFGDVTDIHSLEELPFIPVSLFKTRVLKSIADDKVYKIITSSGTTGSVPSRIYLDTQTAQLQTAALARIMTHVLGNQRLPMIIVDSKSVLKERNSFSARGAGILGLSVFGRDHLYLLDENYLPKPGELKQFLEKYHNQKILVFGFTSMVWQYLYQISFPFPVDLGNAVLIHSGGWKKMLDQAIDNETYRKKMSEKFHLKRMYNFYGMVEQVGSVYIENSNGYLHCPNFSEIIIRNPVDFSVQPAGKEGLIQVISALPLSYPGHSILTEDIGVWMGEDDLNSGWYGKYFKILGRASKADLRGCSDVYAH